MIPEEWKILQEGAEDEAIEYKVEDVRRSNFTTMPEGIHVTVPGEDHGNPWLHAFGRSVTDPDFPEFLEELQRLRTTNTST